MDEAGNFTVYTIQYFSFGPSIEGKILFDIEEDVENPEFESFTRSNTYQDKIDALDLNIDSVISSDLWYILKVKNKETNSTTTLTHTPNTNEVAYIANLNALISHTAQSRITGASYEFTLLNRINKNIIFTYNAQGNTLSPTFVDNENSFIITLPVDTASTRIESFLVYKSLNGIFEPTSEYQIYYDMNGLAVNATGISGASYEFEAGEYYFYFVDNFGRDYPVPKIFGLEDIAEVYYLGTTALIGDVLYTANDVKVLYQTQLYSVEITKNGVEYLVPNEYITLNQQTGLEEIWLKNIASVYGLDDDYIITITSTTGNAVDYPFTIYTKTPEVDLTDSLDNSLNHIYLINQLGFSTTKPVYITYENTPIFAYTTRLELATLDADNNPTTQIYNTINPEFAYALPGSYTLTFSNLLGTTIYYNWSVQETATVIYSVIAVINNLEKNLSISNVKYNYNDAEIDQYFTIYTYKIDKNPDRDLTLEILEILGTEQTGVTTVYYLYGGFYNKVFAVTKIPTSQNFISTSLEINEYYRGNYYYKTTSNPTTVSWADYNLYLGNYIYADYYFNSTYVGKIYEQGITLEDAGMYYFKFSDFAGNTQLFSGEQFYEIILLDEVLFSVNNLDPVDNIIYNEPVSIKIEHLDEYDYRSLSVSATLNGNSITPLKVNDTYIFTAYGLYNITLSASVTLDDEETKSITAYYSFMLLNKK